MIISVDSITLCGPKGGIFVEREPIDDLGGTWNWTNITKEKNIPLSSWLTVYEYTFQQFKSTVQYIHCLTFSSAELGE